jgi:ABC-2 type transport system ATP-binding protein
VLEARPFHPGRRALDHLRVRAVEAGLGDAGIADALERVELTEVRNRRVGTFSLGIAQRLALASALMGDPGVLVLDEPANGLDPGGIRWLRRLLRELAAEGRTVVVSSHVLAEMQQTVDEVLILDRGRLLAHRPVAGMESLEESPRALALVGVLIPATFAASAVGAAFQRGEVATTYLSHPRRARVAAAQAIVYACLGLVFAGLAAAIVVAVGVAVAGGPELTATDPLRIVAGAAMGGAAASALGALLGTLTRNAIVAAGAVVALNLADTLARASGAGPYLPFGLLDSLMGDGDGAPAVAALPLVLAYLGVFAAAVRIWALPRDLT